MTGLSSILSDEQRDAVCQKCGKPFTQWRIADSFLEAAQRVAEREGRKLASIITEIPDGFVPIYCPPCEHRDLARETYVPSRWNQSPEARQAEREAFFSKVRGDGPPAPEWTQL